MPWEKSFDMDDALERAQTVFWAKGYEATSLSDLTKGMGINKGSLYNAFGSKKALFTQALLKYDRDNHQKTIAELDMLDDPVEALTTLFDGLIAECETDADRKGCLLVNTALDYPNHGDEVQELVRSALGDIEAFFQRLIVKGQKAGSIPETVPVDDTAKSLLSLVVGLRVLSRGVFDASALEAIKKDALRLVS